MVAEIWAWPFVALVGGYLLGSIPFGVLLTRADLNARSSFSKSDPSFYYKAYKSYYVD